MPETETGAGRFRVWLRRRAEPGAPYSVRFEVTDGKGILRVARPGVLVDPPARPFGFEERLSAAQVRASRFLHVWDGGRYRQGYMLARLEEGRMDALPVDRWIQLETSNFGVNSALLLPSVIGPTTGEVDDEPTWPRRDASLEAALAAPPPAAPEEARTERREPEAKPRPSELEAPRPVRPIYSDGPRPEPRAAARPSSPFETLDAWAESASGEEDRTQVMTGSALSAVSRVLSRGPLLPGLPPVPASYDPNDEQTMIETFDAAEALEAAFDAEALEAGDEDDDPDAIPALDDMSEEVPRRIVTVMPEAPEELAVAAAAAPVAVPEPDAAHTLHERNTTLVRHLRRQIAKERAHIAMLEHRVRVLEAELGRRR